MKKAVAFLLILVCFLTSCRPFETFEGMVPWESEGDTATDVPADLEETTRDSFDATENTVTEETTAPTDDEAEDDDYLELEARSVKTYERKAFCFSESDMLLLLNLPLDWSLEAIDTDGYRIVRDGQTIGFLTKGGKQGSSDWKLLDTDYSQKGSVLREHYLEKDGIGETLCFRHRFYFRFVEDTKRRVVTMTVEYSELDADAAQHLLGTANAVSKSMIDPGLGSLIGAQYGSIAILGNSFISSSKIAGILYDMHVQNGTACYIDAMSRGYSHIDTYVNDAYLMAEVENGKYDVVFVCGVNSNQYLGRLKEICDASETALVIFPAHNESRSAIDSAVAEYPEIQLMDWKGEIEALINEGRDMWDFCIDDEHMHSTPLAGYVGAHMIYRAIWGEMPSGESTYAVSQAEIDRVLGDYAKTGCVIEIDEGNIILLQ